MGIRIKNRIETKLFKDSYEQNNFGYDIIEITSDSFTEGSSTLCKVPAGATDIQVTFPFLADIRVLNIFTKAIDSTQTPATIGVKFNLNTNDQIAIIPVVSTLSKTGFLSLTTSGISTLFISNLGSIDMYVMFIVAGDV